ncbi:MAG: hypothetical protein Q7T97_00220 [Burkholderiaceae bacterium]|nr:hypothetical protein [Burkholderiaceae bacterium]
MTSTFDFKTTLVIASLLALPLLAQANPMAQADYKATKSRISADHKADKIACGSLAGNAKDICHEEADGKEKVALAELEYSYTGKPADHTKLMEAKAEAAYGVAKEKCDDLAGNPKDVCVKEAKAIETKALADAKMNKKIGEAQTDASQAKIDADYKVAAEKCDALAGDAKAGCVSAAKARFGKN